MADIALPFDPRASWQTTRARMVPVLPPAEDLLIDGGDARLALDPLSGANKYDCRPLPDPDLAAFGSSTASIVSETAFAAADRLRSRLVAAARAGVPSSFTYEQEMARQRVELAGLCGLSEADGVDIVFAASGTDLHLIAAQLVASGDKRPLLAVMVEASETGSGVPAALSGRHFSTSTALGDAVVEGEGLSGIGAVEVAVVPGRDAAGEPRPTARIASEIEMWVAAAAFEGRRVLLTVVDVSKTGLISPGLPCALELRRRFPQNVDILIDACQFRLAPATLRAYLERGFMVAVTGSKFVTGPAFSGALLVPRPVVRKLRGRTLPLSLRAYGARAEFPPGWAAVRALDAVANYGLLLRWEAALAELREFQAVPEPDTRGFLQEFAISVRKRLAEDPLFEPLPAPALDRNPVVAAASWDQVPTIFPFLLRRPGGGFLGRSETQNVYRAVSRDASHLLGAAADPSLRAAASLRSQLGQPVACGTRGGTPVSALRLCASARLAVEATAHRQSRAVIARALAGLDKTALIGRSLPE